MEKTEKVKTRNGNYVNKRKTHRNEPCPCGAKKTVVVHVSQEMKEQGFSDSEKQVPMKFKKCCLDPK